MQQLSSQFLDSCRREDGRILRGENMTRIETFVDAAFAFAFTMLVISIDEIPETVSDLLVLSQDIPAFVISATIIGSIWVAHSIWSRTFGLEDRITLYLSLGLVVLVLIFVYPIKLMVQLSVSHVSQGYLQTQSPTTNLSDAVNLFIYFAFGLIALSFIIIALYQNSLRHRVELALNDYEIAFCKLASVTWLVVAATALISCLGALTLGESISWAGWLYCSLGVSIPVIHRFYSLKLSVSSLQRAS